MVDVSVIIPSFNRLWCLPDAILSCKETICNTEIIVVDDGSSDGTWEWLQTQKNIVVIRQKNHGQTYAINTGIQLAKGKYIRFLDSDDVLLPGVIDLQFNVLELHKATLAYGRVDVMFYDTKEIKQMPETGIWSDYLAVQLGAGYGSHFLGMMFGRNLIEKVPRRPEFAFREDRMFLLEIGLLFPKMIYTEGCMGYWMKHKNQMQSNYAGLKAQVTNWQHLQIFKKILNELEIRQELTQTRKNAATKVLWPLAHWIAKDFLEEAIKVVEWIYELNPDFTPPEKGILGLMYQKLGFKFTENILGLRRRLFNIFP